MITTRRRFIAGMTAMFAAPAIVHATSLMQISVLPPPRLTDIDLWRQGVDPRNFLRDGKPMRRIASAVPRDYWTNADRKLHELVGRQPEEGWNAVPVALHDEPGDIITLNPQPAREWPNDWDVHEMNRRIFANPRLHQETGLPPLIAKLVA